jgi:DNA (cytosine-5)-methyltransferase 1
MDSTNTVTHVSLCAGYGGIDLGLKRAIPSIRTIAFSEIEAFACANLVAKMEAGLVDAAPIWTDLKTFPWGAFRDRVGILSGGYPCQPFSAAGKRLGKDDPRHLWPWIADGIRAMRPQRCFFENVEGHISLGLRAVIEELGSLGYKTTWGIFSAREVGSPHQRKRVFILAERSGERSATRFSRQIEGQEGIAGVFDNCGDVAWPSRPGEPQHGWEPPRVVANTNSRGGDEPVVGNAKSGMPRESGAGDRGGSVRGASEAGQLGDTDCGRQSSSIDTRSCSETIGRGEGNIEQTESRQAKPPLGRDPYGTAHRLDHAELYLTCDNRTDELRLLGNGVVPAVAHRAFVVLAQRLSE